MQFDWPTTDQMLYRINRLRRLVALCVAIPVCVFLIGSLIDPAFLSADRATLAALAVAALVSGHVVLFPNAPLETISLSLSVTLLTVAAPWVKSIAYLAPAAYVDAALILLVAVSVLTAVALIYVLQMVLGLMMMVGPVLKVRLRGAINVGCSPEVARSQYALQPASRRGRILTGDADADGFFDVAILAPQIADPEQPTQPYIMRLAAKVLAEDATSHQSMLVLPNGAVTVTSETFTPTQGGCRVEISELPGDFTAGMHALFWLTDQQMDNLTETADMIEGKLPRAIGVTHGVSFLSVAVAILSPRPPVVDRAE